MKRHTKHKATYLHIVIPDVLRKRLEVVFGYRVSFDIPTQVLQEEKKLYVVCSITQISESGDHLVILSTRAIMFWPRNSSEEVQQLLQIWQ